MSKLFITSEVNGTSTTVNGVVATGDLVKLVSGVATVTTVNTDLILGVAHSNDGTSTIIDLINAGEEYVIPTSAITTNNTFVADVAAGKMASVYFTGTAFTYDATGNTLCGYSNRKVKDGYVIRFVPAVLVFC